MVIIPPPPVYRRPGVIASVLAGVVALVLVIVFWPAISRTINPSAADYAQPPAPPAASATVPADQPPPPSPSPSPSPSASPSSAPPAAAAVAGSCAATPVVPARSLAVTRPQPAGSDESTKDLAALRDAGYDTLYYMGEAVDAKSMGTWLDSVCTNSMATAVGVDPVYNGSPLGDPQAWVKTVAGHPDVTAFVLSMNKVAAGTPDTVAARTAAVNARAKLVKDADGGKPVWCMMDWFGTDANGREAAMKAFTGCDRHIVIYLPWPNPNNYGKVAWIADAGASARALDGANSVGVTQAMNWWETDSTFAGQMGFPRSSGPIASDVADMAKLATAGSGNRPGATSVLVYTEEPRADNISYITACGKAVKPLLG